MNERELIKKALLEHELNKEHIRMAALAYGASQPAHSKGAGFMKKKFAVTALVAVLCIATVFAALPDRLNGLAAYGQPDSYSELYRILSAMDGGSAWWNYESMDMAGGKDGDSSAEGQGGGLPDYSDTNLQVAGVQEADIIKTDGTYIYALSWDYLYILKANDGTPDLIAKIKHSNGDGTGGSFFELYLTDGKLIALHREAMVYAYDDLKLEGDGTTNEGGGDSSDPNAGSGEDPGVTPDDPGTAPDEPGTEPSDPGTEPTDPGTDPTDPGLEPEPVPIEPIEPPIGILPGTDPEVSVVIFDVSDPANPVKLNTLAQEGDYLSSRMVGEDLYLVTNMYIYPAGMEKSNVDSYVPATCIEGEDPTPVAPDDIYVAPDPDSSSYVTVSGIDCSGSGKFVSTKAVLGTATNLYSNGESLYLTNYDTGTRDGYVYDRTAIIRFALGDGTVTKAATGSVDGSIINQFSMDEYDGYFRIATTVYQYKEYRDGDVIGISTDEQDISNGLYILDKDLDPVGEIDKLAPGERIYSVRFDGSVGYMVTFKQVDPLFAVDLADPRNPKVLSALKIPGFSEYLQPFGDGLLFGLGKQTNEDGMVTGLKLSMFDVSDKTNVREIAKYVLKGDYIWTEAAWNHKAILVSADRKLIAFPSYDSYFIFGYDGENGFTLLKQVKIDADALAFGYYYGTMRGLYIDDFLYVYTGSSFVTLAFPDFDTKGTLPLE